MAFRVKEGFDISRVPTYVTILNEVLFGAQLCKDFAQKMTGRITVRRVDRMKRREVFEKLPASHVM
jgi:hypothetical protein